MAGFGLMRFALILTLMLGSTGVRAECDTTGYVATLTNDGMNLYMATLMASVQTGLHNIPVPDVNGFSVVPVIGNISYALTSMVLLEVDFTGFDTVIEPGVGYTTILNGASTTATFNWQYKDQAFPYTGDSGTGTASLTGVNMQLEGAINADPTGHPCISILQSVVDIDDVSIDLKGGASFLYDFLLKLFSSSVKTLLQDTLRVKLANEITEVANDRFKELPLYRQLDSFSTFDESMTKNGVFGAKSFTLSVCGEIVPQNDTSQRYPGPPPIPLPTMINQRMVQIFFDSFMINSDFYSHFLGNYFDVVVEKDDVPTSVFDLTTTSFKASIPALYALCNDCPLRLLFNPSAAPLATILPGNTFVNATSPVSVQAIDSTGTPLDAFKLSLSAGLLLRAGMVGETSSNMIEFQFGVFNQSYWITESSIGDVSAEALQQPLRLLVGEGVVGFFNKWGQDGAVPMPWLVGVDYQDAQSVVANGAIAVVADLVPAPSPSPSA